MKHRIEARERWLAAREALLVREKEHTRLADELAKQRRERRWLPLEKEYRSETEDGTRTLAELFDGRSQLIAAARNSPPISVAGDASTHKTSIH
jgi:predicted dithiol-disulfide oxidoreductase (DUF899 family)